MTFRGSFVTGGRHGQPPVHLFIDSNCVSTQLSVIVQSTTTRTATPMQTTEKLSLLNQHLFIDLPEGRTLVDTGAPFSASTTGRLTYRGATHTVNAGGYMGFTFPKLSENIGVEVHALLGMDLLKQSTLLFDVKGQALTTGAALTAGLTSHDYAVAPMSALPVFEVFINGQRARMIFDTGAQFGYINGRHFIRGCADIGGFHDFSPMFGDMHLTESFNLPFTLAGQTFSERVALAPEVVYPDAQAPLSMASFFKMIGVDGIIGPSWLPRTKLWLNPIKRTFALTPTE